jgi:hypothetical protein
VWVGLNSKVRVVPQVIADSEETIGAGPDSGWKRCSGQATPWMVKL